MKITKEEIMANTVRLLTLNEPFASLMLVGKGETRKQPTNVRGLVCIHSAKKAYPASTVFNISGQNQYSRIIKTVGSPQTQEHILCIGRLINCREMTPTDEDITYVKYVEPWFEENKAGQLIEKRLWVYEFIDMTPIAPIKYKGSQGWSILTDDQKLSINPL